MPRNKQKNQARAAAHHAERMKDVELEKRIAVSLTGCSARVYKAVNSLTLRTKQEDSSDNICLPQVAIFAAGYRKGEKISAR